MAGESWNEMRICLSRCSPFFLILESCHGMHGVGAVELGFSLPLRMLAVQRGTFMFHSQNKSCLQCGQITVLHQILGALSSRNRPSLPSCAQSFCTFKTLLPTLAILFHSPRDCQRGRTLSCSLGQIIPPLWIMTLGSGSLLSQALPLCPPSGSFLSLSLCLVNQISGLSGVFLGQPPRLPAPLTTLTLPFKCCCNGQFLNLKLLRIVTRDRLGGECLEDVSKFLWND